MHNRYLYNSTLRVPLVVSLPDAVRAGHRVSENVSHVDLHPTMLELLGVDGPRSPHGRSLVAALEGGEPAPRDIYAESLVWSLELPRGIAVRSLVRGDLKWIRTDTEAPAAAGRRDELYDMRADPRELHDLASSSFLTTGARMRARLDDWSERLEAEGFASERMALDDSTKAKLRALGYLGD